MNLSKAQIKDIAGLLDMGMLCYVHKETKEVTSVIDRDSPWVDDLEGWEDIFAEVDNHPERYLKLEKMSSRESFQIMEDFTEIIDDQKIKKELIFALNRKKPFRNFKHEVDQIEEVRQAWFKFKEDKSEEWVKDYLSTYPNNDLPEEENE